MLFSNRFSPGRSCHLFRPFSTFPSLRQRPPNRRLRLVVRAFAIAHIDDLPARIDPVQRRPVLVPVRTPRVVAIVLRDRIPDTGYRMPKRLIASAMFFGSHVSGEPRMCNVVCRHDGAIHRDTNACRRCGIKADIARRHITTRTHGQDRPRTDRRRRSRDSRTDRGLPGEERHARVARRERSRPAQRAGRRRARPDSP